MKTDVSRKLQTAQALDFVLLCTQGPLNPINYYKFHLPQVFSNPWIPSLSIFHFCWELALET